MLLSALPIFLQVFALLKERDALKRAAATVTTTTDGSNDARKLESELQKKDELVAQVRWT